MKTIGMLGGMSWESTIPYYRIINEEIRSTLGGLHSAKVLLYSVDFQEIEACQTAGDWDRSAALLSDAAAGLERAGADFLVLCTNTMHRVAPQIAGRVGIPLLHIADAVTAALQAEGISRAALLGTKYTMGQAFYREKLTQAGIEVLVPEGKDAELVNRVIYDELCLGILSEKSKRSYLRIIGQLTEQGAQGIVLGCTEIGLLIRQEDTGVPLFDTACIHALAAVRYALGRT